MQFAQSQYWLGSWHWLNFEIWAWKEPNAYYFAKKWPLFTALQDAGSLETYIEALWITPVVVFSQLKYSWTEKIGEKWPKMVLFYSIWSKIDLQGPLPARVCRRFSGKRLHILNFRQKHMKVHKICYIICPYRKKSEFWGRTPPYRLNQAEAHSTLTRKTGKSQNLRNTLRSMA